MLVSLDMTGASSLNFFELSSFPYNLEDKKERKRERERERERKRERKKDRKKER